MVAITVENIRQRHYGTVSRHSRKQILVFAAGRRIPITPDLIEHCAPKHCRAVGKWNISRTTQEPPAIARTHLSATGVNPIAQRTNDNHVRLVFNDLPLSSKPIGMRNVVCIHTGEYRRARFCYDGIRTAGESEALLAFVELDSLIASGPLP